MNNTIAFRSLVCRPQSTAVRPPSSLDCRPSSGACPAVAASRRGVRLPSFGLQSTAFSLRSASVFRPTACGLLSSTAHSLRPTVLSRPQSTAYSLQSGFTLIEVLVAMTVLAVMVLMVANIFQSSSASWNIGTQKADMNTAARAALDFMARELASAVAGPIEAANPPAATAIPFVLTGGTSIQFIALSGDPVNGRALRGNCFQHDDGKRTLKYDRFTPTDVYANPFTSGNGLQLFVTNVWSLTMYAFSGESELKGGVGTLNYNSNSLPLCLDVAVEMLSDDDMGRALTFAPNSQPQKDYVARNAKLYSTRVYFPNRKGYQAR